MNIDFALLVPEFLLVGLAFVLFGVDLFIPANNERCTALPGRCWTASGHGVGVHAAR